MTSFQRFPILVAGTLVLLGSAAYAQSVISAKSGLIHNAEGDVFLQDKAVELTGAKFAEMKNGDVLRSEAGRAEILLIPGSILWMAENSSIKMVSNRIAHTVVEVLSGSVVAECAQVNSGTEVILNYKDTSVEFVKKGMVRIDTDPAAVKVYSGDAIVTRANETLTLKEGRQTLLSGMLLPEKFDNKVGDSFYRWAARRDASLAAANISAARSMDKNSLLSNGTGGIWGWNPWLSMFTFIPSSGRYLSPFGFSYFSPYSVAGVYNNLYYGGTGRSSVYNSAGGFNNGSAYNSNLGYNTVSRGSQGYSSPVAVSSSPAAAVSSAPSRGAAPTGGGGASRGDGGGGGRGGR